MPITETQKNTYNWTTRRHIHKEKQEVPKCFASPEMQKLRKRSLDKWLSQINEIPEGDVKDKVLCLVWWDFFGGYMAGKNKVLEELRPKFGAGHGADQYQVTEELKRLGYPKEFAKRRGKEPKSYSDE